MLICFSHISPEDYPVDASDIASRVLRGPCCQRSYSVLCESSCSESGSARSRYAMWYFPTHAGLLFWNGMYYVANTQDDDSSPTKFPIHTSVDLQNWTLAGSIFTPVNFISKLLTLARIQNLLGQFRAFGHQRYIT